ncbi:hypothetical protein Taro_052378, partial [Colocasia esculenta]|nr:hypothetical protein [Colocasia esculenta]
MGRARGGGGENTAERRSREREEGEEGSRGAGKTKGEGEEEEEKRLEEFLGVFLRSAPVYATRRFNDTCESSPSKGKTLITSARFCCCRCCCCFVEPKCGLPPTGFLQGRSTPNGAPIVFPDWASFQAYYNSSGTAPIPSPAFYPSPVASSPQGHPYMWAPQVNWLGRGKGEEALPLPPFHFGKGGSHCAIAQFSIKYCT